MKRSMLTTVDNPFSPFDEFEEWQAYDLFNGYHTSSLLARVAVVSEDLSDADYHLSIEQAIDEIVEENVSGMHTKVTREVSEDAKV